jgi:hypothetical protein
VFHGKDRHMSTHAYSDTVPTIVSANIGAQRTLLSREIGINCLTRGRSLELGFHL